MTRPPPTSTLFPYTTLFRSGQESAGIVTCDGESFRSHLGMGLVSQVFKGDVLEKLPGRMAVGQDRKSTRLNSSHLVISYAVFCLKKKTEMKQAEIAEQ